MSLVFHSNQNVSESHHKSTCPEQTIGIIAEARNQVNGWSSS